MGTNERLFLLPLAELVDRLTIDQIKDVMFKGGREAINKEMHRIQHDLDLVIQEKKIGLDARFVRILIALSQLNLHIWFNKDQMDACKDSDPERYMKLLKLSHQLNGVRNQLKNELLVAGGDRDAASLRSNFKTDGLNDWDLQI